MPAHEPKTCERCQATFECKPWQISECQCFGIEMSDAERADINKKFDDCLCRNCIIDLLDNYRGKDLVK